MRKRERRGGKQRKMKKYSDKKKEKGRKKGEKEKHTDFSFH